MRAPYGPLDEMGDARLPAHVEVSSLIRRVQAESGFATVIKKGERDAGTILVVLGHNGTGYRLFERMPQLDGTRAWHCSSTQDTDNPSEFNDYVDRRGQQDPDVWIVELDVADGERFFRDS